MLIIKTYSVFCSAKRGCSESTGFVSSRQMAQTSTANGEKRRERVPRGIGNQNRRRLNMHLGTQIRRAKYINPNCKITLSQAGGSDSSTLGTRTSTQTTGFKAGELGQPKQRRVNSPSTAAPSRLSSVPVAGCSSHQTHPPAQAGPCRAQPHSSSAAAAGQAAPLAVTLHTVER